MMMHGGGGVFKLLLSLAVGYLLCILAKKETGLLKSLGYTIGLGIFAFSIIYALVISGLMHCALEKAGISIPCPPSASHMMKK